MLPKPKKLKITIVKAAKKKGSRWPQTHTYSASSNSNSIPSTNLKSTTTTSSSTYSSTTSNPKPNTASSTTNPNPEPSPITSNPNPNTLNTYSATEFDDFPDGLSPENLPFDWILRNNICGVRFFQNSIKQKQQIHVVQGKF